LLTIVLESISINSEDYVDPITIHRQKEISASELVTGLFEDRSDVANSDITLNSPPVIIDDGLGVGKSINLRFNHSDPD
jgi:hypothetical protein